MRIATWNVNSVKAREARVVTWLQEHKPDVLCLQELKTTDEAFPLESVEAEGYRAEVFGQKTYNGVALISPHAVQNVRRGLSDHTDARLISGEVNGVTVFSAYFPNGRSVGSESYAYKLEWMSRLLELLENDFDPGDPVVLTGDFNVAVDALDAENPERWAESVLCHEDAREALERIRAWGFVDVFRKHNPDGKVYSWWDYRQLAFPKNDGLRIDHIFATESVAKASTGAWIDRNQRKGKKTDIPSDHAPVVADFDL